MSVYAEHAWYEKHYDELSEKERFDHEQDWAAEGIRESVLDREYYERRAAEYYGDDYDEEEWDETD